MKLTTLAMIIAGIGSQLSAAAEGVPAETVFLVDHAAPGPVGLQARMQAAEMFAAAGITIHWQRGDPGTNWRPGSIVIRITGETSSDFHPGALAYAAPYEGVHIQVFYDRIQKTVPAPAVSTLLAHVIVHEITHLLEGVCRHSETGVMKAQWDGADYHAMAKKPLEFAEIDVQLMHRGLETRAQGTTQPTLLAANLAADSVAF